MSEPKTGAVSGKGKDSAGSARLEMTHGKGCDHSCHGEREDREDYSEYLHECIDVTRSPVSL